MGLFSEMMEEASEQSHRVADLEAENARLRAAIEEAIEYVEYSHLRQRLRAALAPTQAEGER
jgi:hypothetical protein